MFRKLMKSSDRISIKFPQFLFLIYIKYFRRSEANETQIISGDAKQARRKSFPAKRSKQDASYFRQSKASETHINYDDARQARRRYFRRSEASTETATKASITQLIFIQFRFWIARNSRTIKAHLLIASDLPCENAS